MIPFQQERAGEGKDQFKKPNTIGIWQVMALGSPILETVRTRAYQGNFRLASKQCSSVIGNGKKN